MVYVVNEDEKKVVLIKGGSIPEVVRTLSMLTECYEEYEIVPPVDIKPTRNGLSPEDLEIPQNPKAQT